MILDAATPATSSEVPLEVVWAGVAAVVVAALIAAVSGYLRTRQLAKGETERLGIRLEAEREHLNDQLAHDRLLRDLEETRTRLDEVIDMGEASLSAVCEARLAFNGGNRSAADEQLWQARQCLGQYGYKERRVRLRIGQEHAVISALSGYRERLQLIYGLAHDSISQRREIPADAWNERMMEVAAAQAGIIEAGEGTLGAKIASDPLHRLGESG